MKLVFKDGKINIYLNKLQTNNLDFNNQEELYNYTKKILQKIEINNNLSLNGYYIINMYLDYNYGVIMQIISEDSLYINYFEKTLDISINIYKDSFLYEVDDINPSTKYTIYAYNNHIYVDLKNNFSNNSMAKFIEKVIDIKYGNEKIAILKNGKILE